MIEHKQNTSEVRMQESFRGQTKKILQNEDRFRKKGGVLYVGLEMEAAVGDENGNQVPEQKRNSVVDAHFFADKELGASQIEWRTDPLVLTEDKGLDDLIRQAQERNDAIVQSLGECNARLLRIGTNPFIPINEIVRTDKKKYQMVPDFHNQHRLRTDTHIGEKEKVDVGDAAVVALLNSLQCNLEATSFEDAIELTNRSFMIAPQIIALSGNARFLQGTDTGMSDLRMIAWETSHDTRTEEERKAGKALRVGAPATYFKDMEDYFDRIGTHPFILDDPDHAVQIGIGLFWNDTRIKIIGDSLVVEFRPISIQPSVQEDLAVMLFYLGRLQWSRLNKETLIPIDQVKENRLIAMVHGIKPFQSQLMGEIDQAESALIFSGVDPENTRSLLEILRTRVQSGKNPSDLLAEKAGN